MKDPLHDIQKELLKKLVYTPGLRFNALVIEDLESEHMNYHLKKLMELKLVVKEKNYYTLTDWGKEFTNRMDDENKQTELQPKTSILIYGARKNKKGEIENLLMRRLKQPYFGKVGKLTGKVRFGESIIEAVKRELFEETGLSAKTVILEELYHKLRKREDGTYVQDVIFYQFFMTDFSGNFIAKNKDQENFFISKRELAKGKSDVFDGFLFEERLKPKELSFREEVGIAEGF